MLNFIKMSKKKKKNIVKERGNEAGKYFSLEKGKKKNEKEGKLSKLNIITSNQKFYSVRSNTLKT